MLTPELRAAAEVCRGPSPKTFDEFDKALAAFVELGEAWLAEHSADDDERPDLDWLAAVGFFRWGGMMAISFDDAGGNQSMIAVRALADRAEINPHIDQGTHVVDCKTRGDVRRLCRCLGVPIGGPQ